MAMKISLIRRRHGQAATGTSKAVEHFVPDGWRGDCAAHGRQVVPWLRSSAASTKDRESAMSGGMEDNVTPSLKDVAKREQDSRERFIEAGGPPEQPSDGQTLGEDRPSGIVSEDEQTGLVDPLKGQ
ncbi:hypothetical protein ACRAWG_19360 [Methylobacterium sp. P31]